MDLEVSAGCANPSSRGLWGATLCCSLDGLLQLLPEEGLLSCVVCCVLSSDARTRVADGGSDSDSGDAFLRRGQGAKRREQKMDEMRRSKQTAAEAPGLNLPSVRHQTDFPHQWALFQVCVLPDSYPSVRVVGHFCPPDGVSNLGDKWIGK